MLFMLFLCCAGLLQPKCSIVYVVYVVPLLCRFASTEVFNCICCLCCSFVVQVCFNRSVQLYTTVCIFFLRNHRMSEALYELMYGSVGARGHQVDVRPSFFWIDSLIVFVFVCHKCILWKSSMFELCILFFGIYIFGIIHTITYAYILIWYSCTLCLLLFC